MNHCTGKVASHQVIRQYIRENGQDLRVQDAEHPVPALRDRTKDNTAIGRKVSG